MRLIFSLLILLSSLHGYSQTVIAFGKTISGAALTSSITGVPVNADKFVNLVEGTPYYNKAFALGKITLPDGKIYDSVSFRINLVDNTLHYKSVDNDELVAAVTVKSARFKEPALKTETQFDYSTFIKTSAAIEPGWYQLLDSGMVTLYKRYIKTVNENKLYNAATYEQTISTSAHYYILINSLFIPVNKIKQLPDMLQDKKNELLEYITSKHLTGKTDKDYVELVAYYNGLFKK
jgi:hypothetical protein